MDAEDGLSMVSFHTGSEPSGWLLSALLQASIVSDLVLDWGPVVVCWFSLTVLCYVLGWWCDLSIGVPEAKCVNQTYASSACWTVSAEQPLFKTPGRASSPSVLTPRHKVPLVLRCSQTLSVVPVILIQHPMDWEKQFYCRFRGRRNSEGGEGNLSLDNSWI